jgi:hypothetical protein
LPFVWNSLWSLALCVLFSVTSSLFCVILCYLLPCVWNSLLSFVLCVLWRDNRESHTQERRSLKMSHTRQERTENNTYKTRDNRESHTQERRSQKITHTRQAITGNLTHKARNILSELLSCVCDSLLSLVLCVLFSVISCLVCEILNELLSCVCDSTKDNREFHTHGKR